MEEQEQHIVRILRTEWVTHDVRRFTVEKPGGYTFKPGQATDVRINKPEWIKRQRPFTFTSLNSDSDLEFSIKIYRERKRVTDELGTLAEGDELIIHDVWGAINYTGPGTFIAAGAGITPFIAIIRQLYRDDLIDGNRLIFSNKTEADIILKEEFSKMLGDRFLNTLTREKNPRYENHRIDEQFLIDKIHDFSQHFYICGPDPFVKDVRTTLVKLGADPVTVVIEE